MIHIRSQVKTRQSQSDKFYKNAKNLNFEILQETLHVTYLLKLRGKIMRDGCGTDAGGTDRWTDGWSETYIPPNNFVARGGYNNVFYIIVGKMVQLYFGLKRYELNHKAIIHPSFDYMQIKLPNWYNESVAQLMVGKLDCFGNENSHLNDQVCKQLALWKWNYVYHQQAWCWQSSLWIYWCHTHRIYNVNNFDVVKHAQ